MQLAGELFHATSWWTLAVLDGAVLAAAAWLAPWRALVRSGLFNVFAGACVLAWLLWSLRTPAELDFVWHLSGMVSLTLIFGWSLAMIAGAVALLGVTGAGLSDWAGWVPTYAASVLVPASFAQAMLVLARAWLPKHYVIYVFGNAFVTAGLSGVLISLASAALLLIGTDVPVSKLENTYLQYLPLMFFPEAMFNGLVMIILVGYRPHWVRSFSDKEYLEGK
jgi:uncharacterized membrane protein